MLRFGAVRYRCQNCGEDLFVAFSCKRRGLCPSCDAKRAAIAVYNASERLLPAAGYRQWVLVVPKRLRFFINRRPDLPGGLSGILAREIELYLIRKSGRGDPGQFHFIQRAGSTLNLHMHIHAVVSDGVFFDQRGLLGGKKLGFRGVQGPDEALRQAGRAAARGGAGHAGLGVFGIFSAYEGTHRGAGPGRPVAFVGLLRAAGVV